MGAVWLETREGEHMSAVIQIDAHQHQNSAEWLEYRRTRGNASELAALLGCAPWFPATPYQLWTVKTGRAEVEETPAMARGSRYEPLARAFYEVNFAEVYEPQVKELGRLSASLDGINFDGTEILEIKVPMSGRDSETWQHVDKHDAPPEHYWWQVQQQLLCSGAKLCRFVVCHAEGEEVTDAIHCYVLPDMQAHEAIKAAWAAFFEHLDADTPPPLTDRDVEERTDVEWRDAVAEWKAAKHDLDAAKAAEAEARKVLTGLVGERSAQGFGVKCSRYFVAGGIDYRKAAESLDLDLSAYEKKGRWQYRLSEQD